MKYYIILVLITSLFQHAFSQDSTKQNNALLLDYYQNQRFDLAADYLKQNNHEPITNIKILKALAYCNQMNGKLPEAETYYERVYAIDSTSTSVLYSLGSINLRRGNEINAEVFYKKIIAKDSTNFIVYKQLAKISLDKKDVILAVNYLIKANKLNPEDADVASDLGDMYISMKAYNAAEKVLNRAIIADPENMILLQSLVKLEYNQKKWSETANNCEKLVLLGNQSSSILTQLGIAYYNLNEYKCGIETFGQIADMEQTETTYYFTGACYKALKDYDKAISYFQKTITQGISPNINSYYSEIADTYETLKKYKKAEIAYQKALQFTETPITWYSLANLYDTELKNKSSAIKYYKKFLATKPAKNQQNYIAYAKSRIELLSK
ncbi:Tetratricopeptide repeat-containing protein [Mucilaginibacter mallensis]|uniref:Tetratricopeptide repeat-containing protein n=1 Tax=Mucilaginibacter mallensis TaxID=652787 RepID=A0A1H1VP88_MUCMA|nr:tetratricopeptide repeat protein [Mucilaginibacter mallensis]SDS86748.1 Tetratricopeptide repeat-containing protein [Mucilaginibacter mallensis]